MNRKNITSTIYTVFPNDVIINCNCTSNAIAVTLYPAIAGKTVTIKKTDSGTNTVTIYPATGETIDGSASVTLTTANEYKTFAAYRKGWTVIDAYTVTPSFTSPVLTTPVISSLYQDTGKTKLMTVPDTASDTLTTNAAIQTLTNKTLTAPTITNPKLTLKTDTPVNAVASTLTTELTGENNDLTYIAKTKGAEGDNISVAYVNPGTPNAELTVGVVGTAITVNLATDAGTAASADIGSGDDGTVTTTVDAVGDAGNDYTIEVVVGTGENVALSAAIDGTEITVTLGTDGTGAADNAKNTAALVAAAISILDGVTAAASGEGDAALTTAEGPTSFLGGVDPAITTTANDIITAIGEDEDADELVAVAKAAENSGAGVVTAMATTNLDNGADGTVGSQWEIRVDDSYIYIAVDDNTVADANWKKVAIA